MKKGRNYSFFEILFFPVYFFYLVIFKDKNIWVFGSWKGEKYNDNPRALFEYVNKRGDVRAVWLTKNDKVCEVIKKRGCECYKFYSLKGIYLCLIAKVVIISVAYLDVSPFTYLFPWKLKIIQLWHGTPLKSLENTMGALSVRLFTAFLGRTYDLFFSATQQNVPIYSRVFKIEKNKIKITGQPRNDSLLRFDRSSMDKGGRQKIILYLPTWRGHDLEQDLFKKYGFEFDKIGERLKKINARMMIKWHMLDEKKEIFEKKKNGNIELLEIDDIYEILPDVDLLITDYSSIYFDYLLLNRPVIFSPFDFKIYENRVGFYHDYFNVTPGPKAQTWNDVLSYVEQQIKSDTFKGERERISGIFNYWQDGESSRRVYKEINKLFTLT